MKKIIVAFLGIILLLCSCSETRPTEFPEYNPEIIIDNLTLSVGESVDFVYSIGVDVGTANISTDKKTNIIKEWRDYLDVAEYTFIILEGNDLIEIKDKHITALKSGDIKIKFILMRELDEQPQGVKHKKSLSVNSEFKITVN